MMAWFHNLTFEDCTSEVRLQYTQLLSCMTAINRRFRENFMPWTWAHIVEAACCASMSRLCLVEQIMTIIMLLIVGSKNNVFGQNHIIK